MEYQFESIGPTLRIIVLVFLIAFAIVALAAVVVIAALPGRIANSRQHPQADAVNICGWLGLPTGVLWVLAMVWAFLDTRHSEESQASVSSDTATLRDQVAELERVVAALESSFGGTGK